MQLTPDNYYSTEANLAYYSVSQIKQFLDCPARAMAELRGEYEREKTTSLLVGGYVDAYFACEMGRFVDENPEIFTKQGELKADYKQANGIIECMKRDTLASLLTQGEKQQIFTGKIDGFPFKVKTDFLITDGALLQRIAKQFPDMSELVFEYGAIIDLKIMKDFDDLYREEEGRLNWVEYWRYDLQMAVYQEIVRQQIGYKLPCYILAFTKEKPYPDRALVHVPDQLMAIDLDILRSKLPEIAAIKSGKVEPERCGRCDYCKATKKLTGANWFDE